MVNRTTLGCLIAALTISCYDTQPSVPTGTGGPGSGTQGPLAMGPALYLDLNGDGRGSGPSYLRLRFDRPIALADAAQLDLRMPTPGDSLGAWSQQVDPQGPENLHVWLGPDASLRSRGRRDSGPALQGQPSILTVPDGSTIRDAATGSFSATGLDMDVFPGLVANTSVANELAGAAAALLVDLNADGAEDLVTTGGAPGEGWLRWQALDYDGQGIGDAVVIPLPDEGLTVASGEMGGNGQVDLFIGTLGSDLLLADFPENAGGVQTLDGSQGSGSLLVADMNRDGTDDLVSAGIAGLWITHFGGDDPPTPALLLESSPRHLALIDANRDGRLDLVAALDDYTQILLGTCQAGYISGSAIPLSTTFDLQVTDTNRDGISDVIGVGPWGARIYRGMGDGGFWPGDSLSEEPTQALSCLDLDGDSAPEVLLLGTVNGVAGFELLISEADEWTQIQTGPLSGNALDLVPNDWDGDGDLDHLVLGSEPHLLTSSLSGTYGEWIPDPVSFDLGAGAIAAMASADWDGDGDTDLAQAELGMVSLWRNNSGTLVSVLEITTGLNRVEDLAFRDIDQDGDLDLFACGTVSGLRIFLNEGGAYVPVASGILPPTPSSNSMAFGDVDRDGDLDLVLGTLRGQPDMVLLNLTSSDNPGSGGGDTVPPCTWFGFEAGQLLSSKMTHKVALADLNGDGQLDLYFGHGVAENDAAWIGNGNGTFSEHPTFGPAAATYDLVLGDLNRDGLIDVLSASEDADSMRSGNGAGTFFFMGQILQAHTTDLCWVDLNGDGIRDLVSTHDFGGQANMRLGPWNFYTSPPIQTMDAVDMHNLELLDLDGDGSMEVIVTSEIDGVPGRLYRAR